MAVHATRKLPAVTGGGTDQALVSQVERELCALITALEPDPAGVAKRRGRPPILPAMLLWSGLVVSVLRGATSLRAVWRLISATGLWHYPAVAVSDDAITKRLVTAGPAALARLFDELTALLLARTAPRSATTLAPFASNIYVLDETTLDPVARKLADLRGVTTRDHARLPGKVGGVFDVRAQLFVRIITIDDPVQNERVAAPELVSGLPKGSLLLFDLGYFSFAWLDGLTDDGYFWITRVRKKLSYEVVSPSWSDGANRDVLIRLGGYRADKAKQTVRLVEFTVKGTTRSYLTNVVDPQLLPFGDIARLYARRWDIERAIDLVKTHLGLHLIWSGKPALVWVQVWAVLIIAQMIQAIRGLVAEEAEVEVEEVSLRLLVEYFPQYAARHPDPVRVYAMDGRRLGFIRPSRRYRVEVPEVDPAAYQPPPPDFAWEREPRYGSLKQTQRERAERQAKRAAKAMSTADAKPTANAKPN
jgi:putative transposase